MKWKSGVNLSQLRVKWRCLGNARAAKLYCLHSSPSLLLLPVPICHLLLQVIAELHSSSCIYFWIIDWLHENTIKREAVFYIVSSPSGSGEILLHTGSFSLPQTLLGPPWAVSFVLLSFLHFLCPSLFSNSAQLLFTIFTSNFLRNSSCRNKHHLHWKHHQLSQVIFACFVLKFPLGPHGSCVCPALSVARGSSVHWPAQGLLL